MITTQVCNYITQGLVQGRKYILKSVAQLALIFQVLVASINNITSPIHVGEQYSCYGIGQKEVLQNECRLFGFYVAISKKMNCIITCIAFQDMSMLTSWEQTDLQQNDIPPSNWFGQQAMLA